jgi:hypothetical protein
MRATDDTAPRSVAQLRQLACAGAPLTDCLQQIGARFQFASPATSLAVFRLLAGAAGLTTSRHVSNGAGQFGTAVGGNHDALIFDPATGLLIGARATAGNRTYTVSVTRTVVGRLS